MSIATYACVLLQALLHICMNVTLNICTRCLIACAHECCIYMRILLHVCAYYYIYYYTYVWMLHYTYARGAWLHAHMNVVHIWECYYMYVHITTCVTTTYMNITLHICMSIYEYYTLRMTHTICMNITLHICMSAYAHCHIHVSISSTHTIYMNIALHICMSMFEYYTICMTHTVCMNATLHICMSAYVYCQIQVNISISSTHTICMNITLHICKSMYEYYTICMIHTICMNSTLYICMSAYKTLPHTLNILSTHTICMNYDSYNMYEYYTTYMHECICTLPHTCERSFNMYEHYTTYMHEYACMLYNMYESYSMHEYYTAYMHEAHEWVMSHMNESCHIWMSHVTYVTWRIHMWHDSFICDMTHSCEAHVHMNIATHMWTCWARTLLWHDDACHCVEHIRTHSASRGAYRAQIKQGCTHGHATCQFPPRFLLFLSSIFWRWIVAKRSLHHVRCIFEQHDHGYECQMHFRTTRSWLWNRTTRSWLWNTLLHVFNFMFFPCPPHSFWQSLVKRLEQSCAWVHLWNIWSSPLHLECHLISISNFNLPGLFSSERGKRDLEN